MKKLTRIARRFFADSRGLETVEYAVMTALIAAAIVLAAGLLVGSISGRFEFVSGVVDVI